VSSWISVEWEETDPKKGGIVKTMPPLGSVLLTMGVFRPLIVDKVVNSRSSGNARKRPELRAKRLINDLYGCVHLGKHRE
jgi:hypothetical protein